MTQYTYNTKSFLDHGNHYINVHVDVLIWLYLYNKFDFPKAISYENRIFHFTVTVISPCRQTGHQWDQLNIWDVIIHIDGRKKAGHTFHKHTHTHARTQIIDISKECLHAIIVGWAWEGVVSITKFYLIIKKEYILYKHSLKFTEKST